MVVRRAAVVALLVSAGALALPVGAEPVRAPAVLSERGAFAVVGPDGDVRPQHRPLDALLSVRDHRDTAAWLRSVADASRLTGADDAPAPLVVDPEASAVSTAAGDLDGDGLSDVLSYTQGSSSSVLHARRGTDGAPLWSRPLTDDDGALTYPLARDLTGDGVDDLLVDELVFGDLQESGSETALGGTSAVTLPYTWRVAVLSGVDGTTVWQQGGTGRIEESYDYTGDPVGLVEQGEYRLRATSFALLVGLSEDVDGDGLPDLVLNDVDLAVDAEGAYATVAYDGTEQTRSTTRAAVVSGRTGQALVTRTATDVAGLGVLLPFEQVTGGPAAELLWSGVSVPDQDATCVVVAGCVGDVGGVTSSVELVDPDRPAEAVWRSAAPGEPFTVPAGDVDGDGAPDVVRDSYDAAADRGLLEVLSGRDGRLLWSAQEVGFAPYLVDVAAGTALTVAFESGDEVAAVLQRRDPRTGAVRSSERVVVRRAPAPPGEHAGVVTFTGVFATGLPDGDGDGARELAVGGVSHAIGFGGPGGDQHTYASQWRYAPLAGGAPLLTGASDDARTVQPTGDLDGDGLEDVVQDVYSADAERADATALRLRDGRPLWRTEGLLSERPNPAGDQDGRPGLELVQDVPGPVVQSRAGADLGLRWSR